MKGDLAVRSLFCGAFLLLVSSGAIPAADQLAAVPRNGAAPQVAATVATDPLVTLVNDAIRRNELRYLDVNVHTPWQIMHGMLAYRNDYQLKSRGEKISAVGYISDAATFRNEYWFEKTAFGGRGHPFTVPYAFEGHVNQFLAILTMCDLPLTHEFVVRDGQVVTMQEMVNHAQLFTSNNGETTWTLWFLSHYLEPDAAWVNQAGEAWSMERLVRTQTQASVLNSPCGGTHQLFALSLARNSYIRKYGRLTGAWVEADQKLQQHIAAAQTLQNRDGSFSVQFFKGQEQSDEFEKRIKASGHMLEWLMAALPERRLKEYWVRRGIETLAYELIKNSSAGAEPGALYHAIHSLVLYRERVAPQPVAPPPLSPVPEPGFAGEAPMPIRTAQEPSPIQLQSAVAESADQPPAPPLSDRNAERAMPILIDEAHPDGVNAPTDDSFETPPPLPPRDARPLVIPNAIRLD